MERTENLIHPPKRLSSQEGMGLPNTSKSALRLNETTLFTSEIWNEMEEPWTCEEVVIAKPGYKWISFWEEGKNFVLTKHLDENNKFVSYYCDIGSTVKRAGDNFYFDDWYLDIFQPAGKEPVILDEDELEQAVNSGFLSEDQAENARKTAEEVVKLLEEGKLLI